MPSSGEFLAAERAAAEHVAAEGDGPAAALGVALDLDVPAGLDLRPAPRAVGQLGRRAAAPPLVLAAVLLLDRLGGLVGRVRRRLLADPEPDAERLLAPLLLVAAPDDLAGTDQGGGPLELLDGQQPQGVPHQDGDPVLPGAAGDRALEPPQAHGVGRQPEVRLGLAAAGGEPEEVGDRLGRLGAVLVVEPGDPRQVEQHEGQLERIPRPVGGHVDGPLVHRLVPPSSSAR